jgi:hypothetical protein
VSGLADATVVLEGRELGGALQTIRLPPARAATYSRCGSAQLIARGPSASSATEPVPHPDLGKVCELAS